MMLSYIVLPALDILFLHFPGGNEPNLIGWYSREGPFKIAIMRGRHRSLPRPAFERGDSRGLAGTVAREPQVRVPGRRGPGRVATPGARLHSSANSLFSTDK